MPHRSPFSNPGSTPTRTAVFSPIAGCFAAAAKRVRVVSSTPHESVIMLNDPAGEQCGDEYGPDKVTADRLTLDPTDGHPLIRERLSGSTVLERWKIDDLQVP